ncbi:RagB/SusD family nutrient uptake outer membrane protein [Parapedobacter defluvii]|uniref:RagB/SusD family nutrient uptake outer membrane protein n=1 Tax=Parapedobacter defluvii TaxID=2045106 RepID=UPI00333E8DEF
MKLKYIVIAALLLSTSSCQNVIDIPAQGVLSEDQINTFEDADALVIAAYSQLGNDHYNYPFSLWPYGNVRSDDAYKGGRDPNDIANYHFLENFQNIQTNNSAFDVLWYRIYIGIRRVNSAMAALKTFDPNNHPTLNTRLGEMYFLRGYWYLKLKTLFKYVPYIDDELPANEYENKTNRELTDQALWDKIASDFQMAIELLPATQTEVGRANQIAAYAYYAKTRLYQAYVQDEENQVVSIDDSLLEEVLSATQQVLNSSYGLAPDYADNFLSQSYENGVESIFAVQFSTDDGVGTAGRTDKGYYITAPQGLGCCDFQKISHNLVNAFKTSSGLPDFENFNTELADFQSNSFDPRLDHTVSRPGIPFKYDASEIVTEGWSRTPSIYGYFNSLKENVSPNCSCYKIDGAFRGNSKNRIEMRFADVLLMRAEALIELSRQDEALTLINQVRARAAASTGRLKSPDGSPAALYEAAQYMPGANIVWNQENARKALRFERRLEFAMENMRFFDLVRWGVAEETINAYYERERIRRPNIYNEETVFTAGRDEYLPIPQAQINFSKGVYTQNTGYE